MHDLTLIIISIKQIYKNVLHIGFYHFPELWVIVKIAKICNRKKMEKILVTDLPCFVFCVLSGRSYYYSFNTDIEAHLR